MEGAQCNLQSCSMPIVMSNFLMPMGFRSGMTLMPCACHGNLMGHSSGMTSPHDQASPWHGVLVMPSDRPSAHAMPICAWRGSSPASNAVLCIGGFDLFAVCHRGIVAEL